MSDKPLLKDRLLKIRLERSLYQKQMADALDVPLNSYRNWEYGKKTPRKMALDELERRLDVFENGFKA